ncbi:hypothetical protein ARNL5_01697 [Anaerolineae bacterium]|nr:hypothetical protein ARNL5_01697 [Anaerolineae bacterium]
MYAQATTIRVPLGTMAQMRQIIENEYLPNVSSQPGFVRAYFLEQTDDSDYAMLIVAWESQADVENYNRNNLLEASVQALTVRLPGVRIQRAGYVVRVVAGAEPDNTQETKPASVSTN